MNIFVKVFEDIASKKNENPGDYRDAEEYLVCCQCNERKELLISAPEIGVEMKVPRMCACARKAKEIDDARYERSMLEETVNSIGRGGLGDSKYRIPSFNADDQKNAEVTAICRKYVKNWEWAFQRGMGILMYGDVGTGKSFLAACIVNALIDQGTPAFMTTSARVVEASQEDSPSAIIQRLSQAKLLVLDDLGMERITEYSKEIINSLIDSRYVARLPIIVTTNLSPKKIDMIDDPNKKLYYRRIFDRLLERSKILLLNGAPRRSSIGLNNTADFDALEG